MGFPVFPLPAFFLPGFQLADGDLLNFLFGLVVPLQRSVTSATQSQIQPADLIINMNLSQSLVWTLPKAAARMGKPLVFVDAGLKCGAFSQTFNTSGVDTIVNWPTPTSLVLNSNGQVVALQPFNDGVNNGWFIPPGVA